MVMRYPDPPGAPALVQANHTESDEGSRPPADPNSISATPSEVNRLLSTLVDPSALHDKPFLLLIAGLLTTFMGIYTTLYYVNIFAMARTSAAPGVAPYILVILNGASTVGRILPSAMADRIGPTHVLACTALCSGILCFCLLLIYGEAGIVAWAVVYGCTAGAFMGLPAAGVVSISSCRKRVGARLGMTLGVVGCGVLIAEPIAGVILSRHPANWAGLVTWSASLKLAGFLFMFTARVAKAGWKLTIVV